MPRFLTALITYLLASSCCFAQQGDSLVTDKQAVLPNEWMIKFAPFTLLEPEGGFNFSGEYLVSRQRLGYQLEAQAILFSVDPEGSTDGFDKPRGVLQSGPMHGIRLRPEVRYYTSGVALNQRLHPRPGSRQYAEEPEARRRLQRRTYVSAGLLYKQIRRQRINEFNIYNGNSQPVFRQRAVYTDVKEVFGFEGKVGATGPIWGEHWLSDIYIGLGIRRKKFGYRNLPSGAPEPAREAFLPSGNAGESSPKIFLSLPFGIKIVYRL